MHLHLPYKCLLSYIIYYHALGCVCGWVGDCSMCMVSHVIHVPEWARCTCVDVVNWKAFLTQRRAVMYVCCQWPFWQGASPLHAFNVHISLMCDKNDWCGHRLRPNHTHPLCLIIFLERWLHHMCVAFVCVCVKLWCIIYLLPYTGIVVKGVDYCFMIICLLFLLFVDYSSAVSDAHHTETGH